MREVCKLLIISALLIAVGPMVFGQVVVADNEFHLTLALVLAILAGCYEVISRMIPTTKTWSIIGKVLEVLTWLSNLFDRKKKALKK